MAIFKTIVIVIVFIGFLIDAVKWINTGKSRYEITASLKFILLQVLMLK